MSTSSSSEASYDPPSHFVLRGASLLPHYNPMNLLMISGDRSMLQDKQGAFWYTLQEFSKHWGRIDVICPRSNTRVLEYSSTRTFFGNVHFHPSPWGLLKQPRWIVQKGHELVTLYKHSVMTVHEYPPFYNGIGAKRLWKMMKVPYALEIHHIVGYPKPASFVERMGKWMSWAYLRYDAAQAAGVRTVSKGVAAQLVTWGVPGSKVRVVPSFYLDRQLLAPAQTTPHYDVVFCGRLVANKGLLETIRAVHKLERASLLVIGDGPQRAAAEALVKNLKIGHRMEFRGWLPTQQDVVRAMTSAKVFVMNSRSEGGPRVALEAMACGLPVVSTKVGVMPDVIEDGVNGLFTDGSPEDLAEKLEELLENADLRHRMGQEARKVLDQFERERLIALYAQYLQSLA
jgi:glycosyltransferase involved in cell wall biosynthesis